VGPTPTLPSPSGCSPLDEQQVSQVFQEFFGGGYGDPPFVGMLEVWGPVFGDSGVGDLLWALGPLL